MANKLFSKVQNNYCNMQLPSVIFKPQFEKIEMLTRKKIPYFSGNGTFAALILKKCLIFREKETLKRSLIFWEMKLWSSNIENLLDFLKRKIFQKNLLRKINLRKRRYFVLLSYLKYQLKQ